MKLLHEAKVGDELTLTRRGPTGVTRWTRTMQVTKVTAARVYFDKSYARKDTGEVFPRYIDDSTFVVGVA